MRNIWNSPQHLMLSTLICAAIAVPAFAASNDAALAGKLLKIPDGYQAGRSDSPYGAYSSVISASGRSLQNRLENLDNKVMGLSKLSNESRIQQSESIFLLEAATLRLHLDIANAPAGGLSDFERQSLLLSSVRTYESIRSQATRLFEDMVRFIDVKLPGPNGLQFRTDLKDTLEAIYLPNYRSDLALSDIERDELYKKRVSEFEAKGGSLSEVTVMTPESLKAMGPYTRVEYVERANGEIWITPGTAGHVLLAGGKAVKSAGQMIFLKNTAGDFTMLIVSNSSGNFKPDILSAQVMTGRLATMLNLPYGRAVVTKGEPLSTQGVKVFSKGYAIAKDVVAAQVKRLDAVEAQFKLHNAKVTMTCPALFAKAGQ